MMMMITAFV